MSNMIDINIPKELFKNKCYIKTFIYGNINEQDTIIYVNILIYYVTI